jgi:hypothetical protein|tara:strand:+ start:5828 stop:6799 length:972 start_codon:yes stop_codon:yes gene_type:complete
MSYGYRYSGGKVGYKGNLWTDTRPGIWDVTIPYANLNEGATTFPITNATIQWAIEGNKVSNAFASNTAQSAAGSLGNVPVAGTTDWVTRANCTKITYQTNGGTSVNYIGTSQGSSLMTNVNSMNGAEVLANGGSTFLMVSSPETTTNSWGRPWTYFGMSTGAAAVTSTAGNVNLDSGTEYRGPQIFFQQAQNYYQYRRPSGITYSNGNYGNYATAAAGFNYGSNMIHSVVIRQTTTDTYYWARFRNYSTGALSGSATKGGFSFQGSTAYGIKNSTEGRPVFNDYLYWSTMYPWRLIASAYANRPYTDAECNTLVEYLDNKFAV